MTEAEWLACGNPWVMMQHVGAAGTDRKLRLFVCACCERCSQYGLIADFRTGVAVAKQFADRQLNAAELGAARQALACHAEDGDANWNHGLEALARALELAPLEPGTAALCTDLIVQSFGQEWNELAQNQERAAQCELLRDIFRDPFRPATVEPGWRTGNVVALAEAIYQEQDYTRLPILADALEDAGCTDVDMLTHCRVMREHVRGCWVVDWVLGKD